MMQYQKFYKLFIIFFIFLFFSKYLLSNEIKTFNAKSTDLFIIGNFFENNNKGDNFLLNNKINILDLNITNYSIYDQINLAEDFFSTNKNDKLLIVLKNYYLESIFFEENYFNINCNKGIKYCNDIDYIQYKEIYLPLINILHQRIENFFLEELIDKRLMFVVANMNSIRKYTDSELFLRNNYFLYKENYCVIQNINLIKVNFINCMDFFINEL